MRPQDDRDLRGLLHEEAERHLPDRDAMLARIDRRRGTGRRGVMAFLVQPVGPGARRVMAVLRPAAAALAVAGVLVAGVAGINLANRAPEPGPQVAGPPASAEPAGTPSATPPAGTSSSVGPAAHITTAAPPSGGRTPTPPVRDRFLSATGTLDPHSIASWSQSNVTLAIAEGVTALEVTVTVARTAGVADTGRWTSVPANLITTGVTSTGTELVYRFTLNAGATLGKGSYTFAAQYNHAAGGRPLTGDSYEATATASGPAHVTGGFTGQSR